MEPTLKECPTCEGSGTIETYEQGWGEMEIAYQDDCPDCLGGKLSKGAQSVLWDVSCAMLCDAPQPEWGKLVTYIASLEEAARLAKAALEHAVPGACWSNGPSTGSIVEDHVVCPGCRAINAIDTALPQGTPTP